MSSIADGRASSKRALSPDPSPVHERKSKILKLDLQQENVSNDLSNKENSPRNSIESGRKDEFRSKENPDEIIMVKHYLATHHRERDEDDDVNGADEQRDHSSSQHPWHRSHPFWNHLIQKTFDETYQCHSNFLDAHPAISTKMRSVLCDWLIEVCEVYHLHRETYHLAIAYVDQYLSNTSQLAKTKLQLLGITALFIAAKIEEIYPPRISEFAYVTDKAYHESDILEMELEIMRALNWHINPITAISWLLIYLQVEYDLQRVNSNSISSGSDPDRSSKKRRVMILPNEKEFLRTSILSNIHRSSMFLQTFSLAVRLLDLCSLDAEYSQYPKNVLAATALLACRSDWPVEQISSLNDDDLYVCSEWMKPFFDVLYFGQNLLSLPLPASRPAPSIPLDEIYSIQIHNISLDLLENVYKKRPKFVPPSLTNRPFRNLVNRLSWLPTPPTSLEKQQHETIVTEEETIEISEVISVQ